MISKDWGASTLLAPFGLYYGSWELFNEGVTITSGDERRDPFNSLLSCAGTVVSVWYSEGHILSFPTYCSTGEVLENGVHVFALLCHGEVAAIARCNRWVKFEC